MRPKATTALRSARDVLRAHHDDLDAARSAFTWPDVGEDFNWAHDWFDTWAAGDPRDGLVVVGGSGRTVASFDDLVRRSNQVARFLTRAGVARGDGVVVMLGNEPALWETVLAAMKIGAVVLPTAIGLGAGELTDRVVRGLASAIVCGAQDLPAAEGVDGLRVRVAVAETVPDGWSDYRTVDREDAGPVPHPGNRSTDPLLRYFTSGTTSRPKVVEHTHTSYPVGHLTTMYWLGLTPQDRHLNVSAPGWGKHAWSSFFAPWLAQATVVASLYSRFDGDAVLRQVVDEGVTSFCAPPTVWRMLLQADLGIGPGRLRSLASSGEPLNPEVVERVRDAWGLTVRDAFGQTEMTATIGNPPGESIVPGAMGRALPGVPVVLLDTADGRLLSGPGEGEVCLDLAARPPSLMAGYLADPGKTAAATGDGYHHTGDVAVRDEAGRYTFVGRTDDVFKSSDYKVSPFELESALLEHPAVAEAAVVPAPDPIRLAVAKAYVSLASGHAPDAVTAASILAFTRRRLASYQRVRRLQFVDVVPKTSSGKIRRADLRAAEAAAGTERRPDEFRDDDPEVSARTGSP